MDTVVILMTDASIYEYLEQELEKWFKVFKLWNYSSLTEFLKENSNSIRAVVTSVWNGTDAELIDSLPKLEIVSTYSVGFARLIWWNVKKREFMSHIRPMCWQMMLQMWQQGWHCQCWGGFARLTGMWGLRLGRKGISNWLQRFVKLEFSW